MYPHGAIYPFPPTSSILRLRLCLLIVVNAIYEVKLTTEQRCGGVTAVCADFETVISADGTYVLYGASILTERVLWYYTISGEAPPAP